MPSDARGFDLGAGPATLQVSLGRGQLPGAAAVQHAPHPGARLAVEPVPWAENRFRSRLDHRGAEKTKRRVNAWGAGAALQ